MYHNILTSDLPNLLEHGNISALTQLWGSGQISNFEYLTHLNKHAGRSFNDLMQYPVFPFILRDYISETLDLQEPGIYRSVLGGGGGGPRKRWDRKGGAIPTKQVISWPALGSGLGLPSFAEDSCHAQ